MAGFDMMPFFSFYGGKWRAAPKYPPPEYDTIIEPFAGAAGYSTRYFDRQVILVERDEKIAALWQYLTRVSAAEILALPAEVTGTIDALPVCQEAKYLIGFWCNAACAQPRNRPSAWMRSRLRSGSYWGERRRWRLAAQVEKIRHWRVVVGDYRNAPDVRATWFVDPPYQLAGRHYRYGSKQIDYDNLGSWAMSRKGQTMVCENVGATWLPFEPFMVAQSNTSKRGKGVSHEALFVRSEEAR